MKLFQSSQKYFKNVGIDSRQMTKNHPYNTKNVLASCFLFLNFISAAAYLRYEANTFYEFADCVYCTSCGIMTGVIFTVIFWKMKEFFEFIEKLENLVGGRITDESKEIYEKTGQTAEKLTERIVGTMRISYYVVLWFPLFVCNITYFTTDLGPDAFEMPTPLSIPFDYKNPIGYLFGWAFAAATQFYIAFLSAYHASFIAGSCLMLISLAKDLKKDLLSIDDLAKNKKNRPELLKNLSSSVKFHSDCKQLIDDFSNIYELIFLAFFIWTYSALCGTLLMIQYEISQPSPNMNEMASVGFEGFWALGFIVFFCEFGHRVFNAFDGLNTAIDRFDWYRFPIQCQKMFPVIMMGCQKTSSIRSYGDVLCIRETLKTVLSGTFSYFMVLREFGI